MNTLIFIFTYIGIVAAIFGSSYLVMKTLEYFYDLRHTLSECRDALKRLEGKH